MRATERKTRLLNDAVALTSKRSAAGQDKALDGYLHDFFKNVSSEDLEMMSPQNIYGAALSHYKLASARQPGEVAVHVYTPSLEAHGWQSPYTIIEIVNDDMPFLFDSVSNAVNQMGLGVHLVAHPVFRVLRSETGSWKGIAASGDKTARAESFIHMAIDVQHDPARLAEIKQRLIEVLSDVRVAVADWREMLSRLELAVQEVATAKLPDGATEEAEESSAFLQWMRDNHFTLLGYAEFSFPENGGSAGVALVEGGGLGILRSSATKLFRTRNGELDSFSPEILASIKRPGPLLITKTDIRSNVHRMTHMDYVGVKRYRADGAVIGERRFVGLFTSGAYSKVPSDIPLLRRKVSLTVARAGFARDSHDGKALQNILDTYPRDELFQTSRELLFHNAMAILRLQERPRTRLITRLDPFERYVSCLVYIPREHFHADIQNKISGILSEAYDGSVAAQQPEYGDAPLARVHYIIKTNPGALPKVDLEQLEQLVDRATRTWGDDLHDALLSLKGGENGLLLWGRYAQAFPQSYVENFHPSLALSDIGRIESLNLDGGIHASFYRNIDDPEHMVRFKLLHVGSAVPLSDCLPMLEHMGLRVIGEHPYEISVKDMPRIWLHDFDMYEVNNKPVDLAACRENLEALFTALWQDAAENDGFNKLVIGAGLDWRDVVVLRAYAKYLRQAGIPYSNDYIECAVCANPEIARQLTVLFHTRFDPQYAGDRVAAASALRQTIVKLLEKVESLDEDRILRRYLNLLDCTLRTNFYQRAADGNHKKYLSFKLNSKLVDELPLPRPMVEIFVYSPRVEGIHLRGGKVARGGLRWSDRREDFRTEILGLVKAQQVKNAVIVPVGSKGGFVPKRLPVGGTREAVQEEGIAAYRTFISGLLDITDNLVGGNVTPPANVVRYDGDDTYLVVAADKGTATFSDIANEVARSYGFWLDDAFASGGSVGYDHKKMAITARGGWEAVKRHFRERGTDIQTTPFRVIGCGDMSGDVFGNAMLLSKQIKLVAAFDHRDIFIDPDPDPAISFNERERLFALPRSSWADYDSKLISKGGGVFSRARKSIPLSPEMQQLAGLTQDAVTPAELIRALLQAETDLLWFGGIGTYLKSSRERHSDAGDKANDALRVDGCDIRAKVIGEGANLGCTQLGRIEYAQKGGAINTDAVDNSAGVDCSDHEVNIKIALGAVVQAGDMTAKQRDTLLASMTDEVAEHVLNDNYQQTLAITLETARAHQMLDAHTHFILDQERCGRLNRKVEYLPDDAAIAARATSGQGLTRPEIAVLMAYAKNGIAEDLLPSDLLDSEFLREDLLTYFPAPLRSKYTDVLYNHRLRREIIAMQLANSIVNRAGITFVSAISEETGFSAADVVRAFVVARGAFDLRAFWLSLASLDNRVNAETQTRIQLEGRELIRRATIWFLRNEPQPMNIGATIDAYRDSIAKIRTELHQHLSEFERKAYDARLQGLLDEGVPEDIAATAAGLEPMSAATELVIVARKIGCAISDVAHVFFRIGAALDLDWLRSAAETSQTDGHWERLAMNAMISDFFGQQRALTAQALAAASGRPADQVVAQWLTEHSMAVQRTVSLIQEMRSGNMSVAKMTFVNRQIRDLLNK